MAKTGDENSYKSAGDAEKSKPEVNQDMLNMQGEGKQADAASKEKDDAKDQIKSSGQPPVGQKGPTP